MNCTKLAVAIVVTTPNAKLIEVKNLIKLAYAHPTNGCRKHLHAVAPAAGSGMSYINAGIHFLAALLGLVDLISCTLICKLTLSKLLLVARTFYSLSIGFGEVCRLWLDQGTIANSQDSLCRISGV